MPNKENRDSAAKAASWSLFCRCDPGIGRKLDQIIFALTLIDRRLAHMAGELDELKASVAEMTQVIADTGTELDALAAKVDLLSSQAGVDPAAVAEVSTAIRALSQNLRDKDAADARP